MTESNKPLGSLIFEYVRNIQNNLQETIEKISKNGEEWAVDVDYNFSFSPDKKVRDYFLVTVIPYINDERIGEYRQYQFKFKSIEAIFLKEVCEVIYNIYLNPDNSESIIENSKVNIEYLK